MFNKETLINKTVEVLHGSGYETFVTQGSFDIVAKRENLLLIKVLLNVDSLKELHALDLRAISYFLSAYPFIISFRNSREHLDDEMVYSRFELPVISPHLFKTMIEEDEIFVRHSSKGRHTQEINAFTLRERRKEMRLTLEELSGRVGITKKAMYEIENKRVNPQNETVKRLESMLGVEITLPYEMKHVQPIYLRPKEHFQKSVSMEFSRIGIDNSSLNSAPFQIVGKENFSLITSLSDTPFKIKNEIDKIRKMAEIVSSKSVMITRKQIQSSVIGIPVISESELNEIQSSKEFSEIIDERI